MLTSIQEPVLTPFDLAINTFEITSEVSYQNEVKSPTLSPESETPKRRRTNIFKDVIKMLKDAISYIDRIDQKHEIIFLPKNHIEELTEKFIKLINSLKTVQLHFHFVYEILTLVDEENMGDIFQKYEPISLRYKRFTKKADISLLPIKQAFDVIVSKLLNEVEKVTDSFFVYNDDGVLMINGNPEALDAVLIVTSKLDTVLEYFPEAVNIDPEDIFAQNQSSEAWRKLYKDVELVIIADAEAIKERYKLIFTALKIGNAMIYKSEQLNCDKLKDRFLTALSGIYYGAKLKEAEAKSSLYLANPRMESAFQVWTFPERAWVKELMKITLPTIDYDKKIYLHRLFPSINKEAILREYESGTLNMITPSTFKPVNLAAKKDLILENIFTKQADAIRLRIISPFPLVIKGINSEKARAMAMDALNKMTKILNPEKQKPNIECDEIIFHIHGGGFVAGSSSSHRMYLYKWAKKLNRIIFSVDYRLAPEYPYPAGLDDIWQAYNWVVNYSESILGIKTNKIVITGDSAGGNLAMALTLRTIKMGIRIPDGILISYPALNLYPKKVVPSYFLALEDVILPYSMLKLCIQAYVRDEFRPHEDPFLSPVMASDELLAKLPPLKIITGTADPLHSDTWRLLHRMQALEKNVQMIVYEDLPHGFLMFDKVEGYKTVIGDTYRLFEELFSGKTHRRSSQEKAEP